MRILVVEDEFLFAGRLAAQIRENGDEVIGPFSDVHDAVHHVAEADAAILDICVGDDTSFAIADMLRNRETPFLFLSDRGPAAIPARFAPQHVYRKPSHALPLLDNLRARLPTAPADAPSEHVVIELLSRARRRMPDRFSAERAVEAAMQSAIREVQHGRAITDLRDTLFRKLGEELSLHRSRHLH